MSVLKEYNKTTQQWEPMDGGTVNALTNEEMMELFADTGLTETAGLEYIEYIEDPNGEYVYDETIQNYRPHEEGDIGTRYSADSGYAGCEENGTFYMLIY